MTLTQHLEEANKKFPGNHCLQEALRLSRKSGDTSEGKLEACEKQIEILVKENKKLSDENSKLKSEIEKLKAK